jgi:uncharacterized membrane protein required for colicin V production
MNWLVILVVLVIAWNMVAGYRKGLLRVLYALVEWLLIIVFVTWASPYVADFIMNQTGIPDYIEALCIENMKSSQEEQMKEASSGLSSTSLGEKLESLGISLPDSMTEKLFDSSETQIDEVLSTAGNKTGQLLEQSGIYELIAQKVTALAVNGIAYVATLIVALIAFHLLGHALGVFNRIPLLGNVNRALGFAAGSLNGLVFVWVLFAIVAAGAGTGWGRFVISYIAESPVLVWLYQNNLLVTVLLAFL